MKLLYVILTISLLASANTNAQEADWQWTKRGGGLGPTDSNPHYFYKHEKANDAVIDSDNNYYIVGEIGNTDVTFDGISIDTYNTNTLGRDAFLISFTCEGDYRWHKIFGGTQSAESALAVSIDENDDVYVSGHVRPTTISGDLPVHFDNDSIMGYGTSSPNTTSINNKKAYLIKYDQEGDFQWLRMPEEDNLEYFPSGASFGHYTEADGTTHLLAYLHEGTHVDGQLEIDDDHTLAIIKYDINGDVIDQFTLPIIHDSLPWGYRTSFEYDENLQRYYVGIDATGQSSDYYEINDVELENAMSLVALDHNGQYLWQINNEQTTGFGNINNVKVDEDSNIYVVGRMISDSGEYSQPEYHDSFAGFENSAVNWTGHFGDQAAFVVKLDSDGELIWGSNPDYYTPLVHGLEIDDDYVYMSSSHSLNSWGDFEIDFPLNSGFDPFFAVLDKQTGIIQDFVSIEGMYDGSTAHITTIKKDKAGNLLLAGTFMNNLFFPYGPELALAMSGPHGDIFVAKYGDDNCTFSSTAFEQEVNHIQLYPNPASHLVYLESKLPLQNASIYNIKGQQVLSVKLQEQNSFSVQDLSSGVYFVKIQTQDGKEETKKLIVK
ncbi:MAG: T9SS type A sorting domain-containing protein [Bacteroidota bacterium]